MRRSIYMGIACVGALAGVALYAQETPPPVETCGTDVPKSEAEARGVLCPEGYVGVWTQTREAGSCDWQPPEPKWYSCSLEVEPVNKEAPPIGDTDITPSEKWQK